jgi:hypothetical protein
MKAIAKEKHGINQGAWWRGIKDLPLGKTGGAPPGWLNLPYGNSVNKSDEKNASRNVPDADI